VLGGTGFIGRNVCVALRAEGFRVVTVARNAEDTVAGTSQLRVDLLEIKPGDLTDMLAREKPGLVVNAAGAAWPDAGRQLSAEQLAAGNVTMVRTLIDSIAELPARPRLIHLGSTYEYGAQETSAVVTESTPEQPVTEYGRTKLAGTRIVLDARGRGDVDAVVLRLTATAGPWAPVASLLGMVAHRLASKQAGIDLPRLQGERDFVDSRDVADAVIAAARAESLAPVLNIASGRTHAVRDVVDLLIQIAGRPDTITWQPAQSRPDATLIGTQWIDISAARESLGWAPRRTLKDTLTDLWRSVHPETVTSDAAGGGRNGRY
jgi:NDP-hexose 4-ketoreductase